jgi:hypothetical protein
MIKVVLFIQTIGGEKFKEFLAKPFTIDMLYPVFDNGSVETLFEGWHGKDMNNWYKFTNEEKYVLEFYPNYYIVTKEAKTFKANDVVKYQMPIPKDINDFINDMHRFGIQLYWTKWVDENFEPKDYLDKDMISKYYKDLLFKMGKFNDLQ